MDPEHSFVDEEDDEDDEEFSHIQIQISGEKAQVSFFIKDESILFAAEILDGLKKQILAEKGQTNMTMH